MKHILLNQNHDICNFASDDDCRYVIKTVHYNKEKGCVEATNGMALIRVPVLKDEKECFPVIENSIEAQDCIIPVDKYEKALKLRPKNSSLEILNNIVLSSTEKNKIVFTANDVDTQNDLKVKEIEGKYPIYEHCIPTEPATLTIGLSADVLKPIIDYALKNSTNKQNKTIRFKFIDGLSAVRFEVDTASGLAEGVLMPVRLS